LGKLSLGFLIYKMRMVIKTCSLHPVITLNEFQVYMPLLFSSHTEARIIQVVDFDPGDTIQ
jgi:hypothetical protein